MSTKIIIGVLLVIAGVTATAFACGWMGTPYSVRFHGYQTERDMGRLPPLPTLANGMNPIRLTWEMEWEDADTSNLQEPSDVADAVWFQAHEAEKQGKLSHARVLLKDYLERTKVERGMYHMSRQERRNSAIDRLDALSALDHGTQTSRVQAYLNARRTHDENTLAEIESDLNQTWSDVNLKDNVAYLRAARLYRQDEFEQAAKAFSTIARQYSQSEKREASLFMAAIAVMKTSTAYSPTSGDEAHLHEDRPSPVPHTVDIDEAWHNALTGFRKVMTQYPRGRYFDDARGWMAYLLLRKGDRAGALVEYYRLLADKLDENTRVEAAFSLELVRHHASDEEMSRVEQELAREPEAALAYAYHAVYNYSIDPGAAYPPYEELKDPNGNYDYEASRRHNDALSKDWEIKRKLITNHQLTRVLTFSRRLMDRYPKLAVGGAFAVRAAQASLELGQNKDAARFARRALQSRQIVNERMQALWILGVAEHRLKNFSSARDSFNTLLRDYPRTDLTTGARRHLAMIAEDSGDIDGALEQYIAMNYALDVAYFVDILMTIEQLEGFVQRHPNSPKANELTYALGVRYLRSNRWNDARTTFAKVTTSAASERSHWSADCLHYNENCIDPKEGDSDEHEGLIITTRLVMRDVQTANDLEALERAVDQAAGEEAKAEAMYQLASYQYEASTLLFYNPVAWSGIRYWNLSYVARENRYRVTNESQILFAYMQEHDTPARALKIYLEVVDKYPHTRAARDSLYTAAVCHERLANYNDYWREIYGSRLHAGARLVTYANVEATYPSYQLPRGTFGWQPSTRTVNGGPGFAAPPKQVPRPSKFARVKLALENFINPIVVFWNETGRRGLSLLTILIAMGFTERIANQNRNLLRPRLLRVRRRNAQQAPIDPPQTEMFWTADPREELWEKAKAFVRKRLLEFCELMQDSTSRPIVLRNILSHSFLAGLIVSLLWTLHFG